MNFGHGFIQLFIAFDQLLNVILSPFSEETWADETLSSRCGRLGHRYPYKFYKPIIDILFWWQGPLHCFRAFEKECSRYHCPPIMRNYKPWDPAPVEFTTGTRVAPDAVVLEIQRPGARPTTLEN